MKAVFHLQTDLPSVAPLFVSKLVENFNPNQYKGGGGGIMAPI